MHSGETKIIKRATIRSTRNITSKQYVTNVVVATGIMRLQQIYWKFQSNMLRNFLSSKKKVTLIT